MHNRDRTFYQYALLNLAILHADFGCYSEAVTAIEETISTARENSDMGCLNYSLSWLYHFGKAHPEEMDDVQKRGVMGAEKETLAFLKAKAKETNIWSLLSTSLLSEAKLALGNVNLYPSLTLTISLGLLPIPILYPPPSSLRAKPPAVYWQQSVCKLNVISSRATVWLKPLNVL